MTKKQKMASVKPGIKFTAAFPIPVSVVKPGPVQVILLAAGGEGFSLGLSNGDFAVGFGTCFVDSGRA